MSNHRDLSVEEQSIVPPRGETATAEYWTAVANLRKNLDDLPPDAETDEPDPIL